MNKSYNNIEVTPEEMASLEETNETTASEALVDESTEAQTAETEETSTEVIETESAPQGFEIDGESYDADTIKEWMSDSQNKSEWSKTNTQKAQDLAKWNKLVEKINEDDEFRSHMKDYFFDDESTANSLGLNGTFPDLGDNTPDEEVSPLEGRLEALEEYESERVMDTRVNTLDSQLTELEKAHPSILSDEGTRDFLTFTEDNAERFSVDGMPSLELAFKEWSYDAMNDQLTHFKKLAENKSRNDGKIIGTSELGAKESKSPKKYNSFKEMSINDPDIAKYFNE
jgi:hypothetical protein